MEKDEEDKIKARAKRAIDQMNDIMENAKSVKGPAFSAVVKMMANGQAQIKISGAFAAALLESGAPVPTVVQFAKLTILCIELNAETVRLAAKALNFKNEDVQEALTLSEQIVAAGTIDLNEKGDDKDE